MDRVILHSDCNCFFASVEMVLNPKLKTVPMAVCGDPEKRHGVILAKNELAKKFNINTAETVYKSKNKCPNLVLVAPHYSEYIKYSRKINEIYRKYTDLVEPFGIDEAWLDVTSSQKLFGTGEEIANKLRKEVKEKLGITISVGVSFNKIFAKLGSDYKKPDAVTIINRKNYKDIVYPLKVSELLYCGKATSKALNSMGIYTIGDLANSNKDYISKKLGKIGESLYEYANGNDNLQVASIYDVRELKSISHDITFEKNLVGLEEIKFGVSIISQEIGARIRKINKKAMTVQVSIKDINLKVTSKQITLETPINLNKQIIKEALELILSFWKIENPIRMISIALSNFVDEDYVPQKQISIFDKTEDVNLAKDVKQEKLEKTIDKIRNAYGDSSVINANLLENKLYNKENFRARNKID